MADLMQADAIYWFCDFDDETSDKFIEALSKKIIEKKINLYIHTLDKRPPSALIDLAERSGGGVQRKRL